MIRQKTYKHKDMDYTEAFKNLRTNNKWGRKSPHKAVLMLTVIEMFEQNILIDNEIYYDDKLKSMFLKVWNRVLPSEPLFHPDAYLPFWYLQNDSFWHIVPVRGKEDILALMRDNNVKPSEAKLYDSVKCAELDEDLYFLMTLSSGRSSLKRVLLETYTSLSEVQIDRLSESMDNTIDYSTTALSEYEKILSHGKDGKVAETFDTDKELVSQFQKYNEDVQIELNLQYYSYLKKHRNERDVFKEMFPSVYDLFDKIINHPIKQDEISPSFAFDYENFLSDLKISLMSEDGALELIDKIGEAVELLHGNYQEKEDNTIKNQPKVLEEKRTEPERLEEPKETSGDFPNTFISEDLYATENRKGKPWTENEEELIALYFKQGKDTAAIANVVGRTEIAIKSRLGMMGLIDYTYGQDDIHTASDVIFSSIQKANRNTINLDDFTIENSFLRCALKNKRGDKVFSAEGKLKRIGEKLYRLNLKDECFTIKDMQYDGSVWMRGEKKIVAYPGSALYDIMAGDNRYERLVEDIIDTPSFFECRIQVSGRWYDNKGEELIDGKDQRTNTTIKPSFDDIATFVPKGKLRCIGEVVEESYDFLLTMSVVEFMQFTPQPTIITFDRLACMMIAVAWEILGNNGEMKEKEEGLCECIQFLMDESKEGMSEELTWGSTRKEVFNAIKDYPMAGVFEDTVDILIEDAPYNVLKAWLKVDEKIDIEGESNSPSSTCLYGIHPMKRNPYIEVKKGWMRYLYKEHDSLMNYFKEQYLDYLESC